MSKLGDALEERFGFRKPLRALLDEPIHGGARVGFVLGMVLLALVVIEAITGLALMTAYAPSTQSAWASVHYIQHKMPFGWVLRGVHFWAAQAIVVLLILHLLRVIVSGAYKKPRDVNFWLGLAAAGVLVGMAMTGARLLWDQTGYWATKVEIGIASTMPVIGNVLAAFLQGGPSMGNFTLTRFYALHVGIFPALMVVLVLAHLALRRRYGFAHDPAGEKPKTEPRSKQLAYDGVAALIMLGIVFALAVRHHGAPLDAPADPSSDYPARPEWFLLPLYELRKHFHGKMELMATVVIPGIATALLVLLPVLDRKKERTLRQRLPIIAGVALGLFGTVFLVGVTKRHDMHDEKLQKAIALADERARYTNELALKGVPPSGPLDMLAHDPQWRGEEIFAKECATCHTFDGKGGPKGKGGTAPDLQAWGSAAWVEETMRDPDGKLRFAKSFFKGEMPSSTKAPEGKEADFKPMPEADIKAVAAYVAEQAGGPQGADHARGKEVFGDACGGCHKLDGQGGDDSDLAPDLTGWGTYRWLRSQIADPAKGDTYKPEASDPKHKGHMPTYAKSDIAGEIDLITQYTFWKARGRWPTPEEMGDTASAAPASSAAPSASGSASAAPAESAAPQPSASAEPAKTKPEPKPAKPAPAAPKGKGAPPKTK